MKFKTLLRPSLTIVFAFIGAFIARGGTPPTIFAITGEYFLVVAALAFGTLGFILPEILELAGRAGISALARQIVRHLPDPRLVASYSEFARSKFPYPAGFNPMSFVGSSRRVIKYINPMVVDTSVLVDGRIVDIAKSGFVFGTFIVIPAVVSELHALSDSFDDLKRARGRRGLDVLSELRKQKDIKVEISKNDPKAENVDSKLVKVAGGLHGKLLTVDFNLNKVAKVRGISVLNINELANAVKTAVLPHEPLKIKVNTVGKEKDQGVGYLSDGTMVVIEGGAKYKGKIVDITVLRVLQTQAGKMIFGRVD